MTALHQGLTTVWVSSWQLHDLKLTINKRRALGPVQVRLYLTFATLGKPSVNLTGPRCVFQAAS